MAKNYSGIDYIDSLLSYSGQPTTPVNSWSTATTVGSGVSLTYDWMTTAPTNAPAGGFQVFSAVQEAGAEAAMALFSEVADITFSRQPTGTADMEFGTVSFGGSMQGYTAGLAANGWTIIGNPAINTYYTDSQVYLTNSFASMADQTPGGPGFSTMLHEIGHALGLEHTFEGMTPPAGTDSEQYSMMSYTSHPGMATDPATPLLYDIAALQYLYGANTTTRTGNDTYSWAANEASVMAIWDAGGQDTIDASSQTRDATISLLAGSFSSIGSNGNGGDAQNNIAIAHGVTIENAIGGSGNDTLVGNAGNNGFVGGAGNDTMDGGGGIDTASYEGAGSGVTVILTKGGNQQTGGAGSDKLTSIENLIGSAFDDNLYGDAADNILEGGDGADRIVAQGGNDTLRGGAGDDILKGRDGNDMLYGDAGSDILFADSGTDTLFGGDDNDFLYGGALDDVLHGGKDNDRLRGNLGVDEINGNIGDDVLFGGGQNDVLNGGNGTDYLWGENGNDRLDGGTGNDVLRGGAGTDTFVFQAGNATDRIRDWEDGTDKIDLSSYGFANAAAALAQMTAGTSWVTFTSGTDQLIIENEVLADMTASDLIIA